MKSKLFNDPVHVKGAGWYATVKNSSEKMYIRKKGCVEFGVHPDGYFNTKQEVLDACSRYEKKIKGL
jgi:hypothetical protein